MSDFLIDKGLMQSILNFFPFFSVKKKGSVIYLSRNIRTHELIIIIIVINFLPKTKKNWKP